MLRAVQRVLVALSVTVTAVTGALATATAPASAATVPPGFTDVLVAAVPTPTGLTELSGGRMLVLDRSGRVIIVRPDASTHVALDISSQVCTSGEQGLLGAASDLAGGQVTTVFLYYTVRVGGVCTGGFAFNRVSAWTLTGDDLSPRATNPILLDRLPTVGSNHNGGDLHVAADGRLYVTVGDGGGAEPESGERAQDLSLPNGKVLRIGLDGSVPADNPYAGGARCNAGPAPTGQPCAETYAWGLRNPFRLAFDEDAAEGGQTVFRINDVGQDTWEEIDDGAAGANYGWPEREGPCAFGSTTDCGNTPPEYTDPVAWYGRESGCQSITGGAFVPSGAWPGYEGAYVFADFVCRRILVRTADGGISTFSPDAGQVIDMEFVREAGAWSLYYTTFGSGGQLRRITADAPPFGTPSSKFVPLEPTRILDTRLGLGAAPVKPVADSTLSLAVTGDVVPVDAVAVALNLTVTEPVGPGYATAFPAGTPQPATSDVNVSEAGEVAANATAVALGTAGRINVYVSTAAHLVADVTGFWVPTRAVSEGRFTPVPPSRLLDTRETGRLGADGQVDVPVLGQQGVPPTGVEAVALTVTYTGPEAPGYLTVWPTGTPRPTVSTSNPNGPGDIRSNLVMLPLGANGAVSVYAYAATDVVIDVVGYFTDDTAPLGSAGLFVAVPRLRVLDTRFSGPPDRIAAGATLPVNLAAYLGVPATGAVVNLTATNTVGGGYLTAFPVPGAPPLASTVNWSGPDQHRAALGVVTPRFDLFAYDDADVAIDLSGWFTG